MPELYQCLVFLIQTKQNACGKSLQTLDVGSDSKGYALVPGDFQRKCPRIDEIFTLNGLQVLKDDRMLTLANVTVEVMELLLDKTRLGNVSILAEDHNKETLDSLFRSDTINSTVAQFSCDHLESLHPVDVKKKEVVDTFLRQNSNIPLRHPKGGTLLHLAVVRENVELVELLLKSGSDVNSARHADAATPLVLAVVANHSLDTTRSLLKNGADIATFCHLHRSGDLWTDKHVRENYLVGGTPLHYAIDSCRTEAANLLLDSVMSIDIDEPCADGRTPLQLAVDFGSSEFVQALFKHQPDINNPKNHKVFVDVISYDDQLVRVMRDYGFRLKPVNCTVKLLLDALYLNNTEIVRDILTLGVDLSGVDERGCPVSVCVLKSAATAEAPLEIWRLLLRAPGLDINARYSQHESPVAGILSAANNLKIVTLLVQNGLNVFENLPPNPNSRSFVNYALSWTNSGSSELLEILLNYGADANCKKGETVKCAAVDASPDRLKLLLKYGVQIDDNFQPLHYAINFNCSNNLQILLDYSLSNAHLYTSMQDVDCFKCYRLKDGRFMRTRHLIKYECLHGAQDRLCGLVSKRRKKLENRCISEIGQLKAERVVTNSAVSFYDLLVGNVNDICRYARNEAFTQILLSEKYQDKFLIYGQAIHWQFRRGFYRRKLIDRGVRVLSLMSELFSPLPNEIMEKIVDHLTNWEILLMISDRSYVSDPLM